MKNSAFITATLAAGSVASPYFVQLNVSQKLCNKVCKDNTPVFAPAISFVEVSEVATGQYVAKFHIEGVISYLPCGSNCTTKTMNISQDFPVSIASATAPTSVSVVAGAAVNALVAPPCQNCTRDFVSEIPLTVTVATA